jgi:putative addiction module CopG family antidote
MTTISIPIPENLVEFIDQMVKSGEAETKAEVVRQALRRYAEEEAITAVLKSRQEMKEGKLLNGDLVDLVKEFRKKESKISKK